MAGKGCFCLTGSGIHLPTSVPLNIPRRCVSHLHPYHPPFSSVLSSAVRYIKHPISTSTHHIQTEQVIRCSSIAHLVHKTCEQGQASGLKKISTPRFAQVVFFSPPLHTPHPHFTLPLLHTRCASFGAQRGVAACFAAHRSLNPHPWLLLPP